MAHGLSMIVKAREFDVNAFVSCISFQLQINIYPSTIEYSRGSVLIYGFGIVNYRRGSDEMEFDIIAETIHQLGILVHCVLSSIQGKELIEIKSVH